MSRLNNISFLTSELMKQLGKLSNEDRTTLTVQGYLPKQVGFLTKHLERLSKAADGQDVTRISPRSVSAIKNYRGWE